MSHFFRFLLALSVLTASSAAQAQTFGFCGDGVTVCNTVYAPVSYNARVPGYCTTENDAARSQKVLTFQQSAASVTPYGEPTEALGLDRYYIANPDATIDDLRLVGAAPSQCASGVWLFLPETIRFVDHIVETLGTFVKRRDIVEMTFQGTKLVFRGVLDARTSPSTLKALNKSKATGQAEDIENSAKTSPDR